MRWGGFLIKWNCSQLYLMKSYKITPIKSTNLLKVSTKLYGGYKYKTTCMKRRDGSEKKFLDQFRKDPVLVPVPFLEAGKSPNHPGLTCPCCCGKCHDKADPRCSRYVAWVAAHQWNCLAQEGMEAEKKLECTSSWVTDLFDQWADQMLPYGCDWGKTTVHPIGKQWRHMYKAKKFWNSGKTNKQISKYW